MPIHVDHRPSSWKEFVGNESLVKSLRTELKKSNRSHAYLFYGESGVGKTTLARLIAKELKCATQNIIEYNIADNTSVENAREIARSMKYVPLTLNDESKVKVYILDEFHRASPNAQDCLLKPLEEPSDHAYFIICTTDPNKVVKTIRSRCMQYEVRTLNVDDMLVLLDSIAEKEHIEIDEVVLEKIAKVSEGRAREALKLLGQVSNIKNVDDALSLITLGIEDTEVIEVCRAIANRKDKQKWKTVANLISNLKVEPEKCRLACLSYFTSIMLNQKSSSGTVEWAALKAECFENNLYNSGKGGFVLMCYKACIEDG
jgi:DNA polymerase-3 subunit gamma/tau